MKRVSLLTIGFTFVLALAPSTDLRAQSYTVNADSLYIRLNPRGFFLGTLYNAGFYRRQTSQDGNYFFGYGTGNFQACGWVEAAYLVRGGNTQPACSATGFQGFGADSRQYLLDTWARNVNDYVPNAQTPLPLKDGGTIVHIKAGSVAGLYGNYRGGTFQNRYPGLSLDSTAKIAWRWVSDDGRAVAVNLNYGQPNAVWGFIPREDLPAKLPYSDGISR